MRHDHDKKCLDDRIMVDTSNAVSPGLVDFVAWRGMMNNWQGPLLVCILWRSLS
jgi:hypothetical protein